MFWIIILVFALAIFWKFPKPFLSLVGVIILVMLIVVIVFVSKYQIEQNTKSNIDHIFKKMVRDTDALQIKLHGYGEPWLEESKEPHKYDYWFGYNEQKMALSRKVYQKEMSYNEALEKISFLIHGDDIYVHNLDQDGIIKKIEDELTININKLNGKQRVTLYSCSYLVFERLMYYKDALEICKEHVFNDNDIYGGKDGADEIFYRINSMLGKRMFDSEPISSIGTAFRLSDVDQSTYNGNIEYFYHWSPEIYNLALKVVKKETPYEKALHISKKFVYKTRSYKKYDYRWDYIVNNKN